MIRSIATALTCALALCLPPAYASEFALAVSPPRFEIEMQPGEKSRQVLEITNASQDASPFAVRTADWSLDKNNSVTFFDALQPGSCRPWIALERRELTVTAARPYRFRYEIHVPPDAPPGECRFAIMLEGQEQVSRDARGVVVPFSARLGVVVYLAIGGVQPELSIASSSVQSVDGRPTAMLDVQNTGLAHGRMAGFLSGRDAAGTALEFAPANLPILPGEMRRIALTATRAGDSDTAVQVKFPVVVSGKLEWGKNKSQSIEQRFAP
jgi:hypothetical protein